MSFKEYIGESSDYAKKLQKELAKVNKFNALLDWEQTISTDIELQVPDTGSDKNNIKEAEKVLSKVIKASGSTYYNIKISEQVDSGDGVAIVAFTVDIQPV